MGKYASRRGDISDLEAKILRGAMVGMRAWLDLASQRAENLAPVDTSRLAKSIHVDPDSPYELDRLVFTGIFGSNVEYARAHELGSGIHASDPAYRELILIEAGFWTGKSDKKALAFHWPGGPKDLPNYDPETDKFIFRRVYHPGVPAANQGKGYLRPAAQSTKEDGPRLVVSAITAELKKP
jgi:hypothetical protein